MAATHSRENLNGKQAQKTWREKVGLAEMLKGIAEKKKNFLENLPEDVGGQVKELQEYEFMDPEAGTKFQELMEMLKKAMTETFFKDLRIAGFEKFRSLYVGPHVRHVPR